MTNESYEPRNHLSVNGPNRREVKERGEACLIMEKTSYPPFTLFPALL